MLRQTAVLASLVGGCFSVDPNIQIKCDADNPCMAGQSCIDSVCVIMDGGAIDQAGDTAIPDQPCKAGNGSVIGTAVSACPGAFGKGQGASLCGKGYAPCLMSADISLSTCNLLDGFFVGNIPGYYNGANRTTANCGLSPIQPLFFGCGNKSRIYVIESVNKCGGFALNLECGMGRPWTCDGNNGFDTLANTVAGDGVLCCKL